MDKKKFEQASQKYLRRLAARWTSLLSIPRKVKVTNTFAYLVEGKVCNIGHIKDRNDCKKRK